MDTARTSNAAEGRGPVEDVLAGRASYDELTDTDQAVVRAAWATRTEERLEELDLAAEFGAAGRSYVELDTDGLVAHRHPTRQD